MKSRQTILSSWSLSPWSLSPWFLSSWSTLPERLGKTPRTVTVTVLVGAALALTGCEGNLFGYRKDAPDEFAVITHKPLEMPPNFNLRPPEPGAERPQEESTSEQAAQHLFGEPVDAARQETGISRGEQALLDRAGTEGASSIRQTLEADAQQDESSSSLIDRIFQDGDNRWKEEVVDPEEESGRLRNDAAQPPSDETPAS